MFSYFSKVIVHNIQNFSVVNDYFAFFSKHDEIRVQTFVRGKVFTVLQQVLLLDTISTFKLLKYSLFALRIRITQKYICFLYFLQVVLDLVSLNLLLILDLVIRTFLWDLVMNGL